jgi:hypothetical protein
MNKSQTKAVAKILAFGQALGADYMARALSAEIRCAMTAKSKNELITIAAGWPAVTNSPEFII